MIGDDVYLITKRAPACGFASSASAEVDVYRAAGAYCTAQGLKLSTVEMKGRNGVPFARCADATLKFRCVPSEPQKTQTE
jgi:hypothetical protein